MIKHFVVINMELSVIRMENGLMKIMREFHSFLIERPLKTK
jgi:hypothetical protein